MNKITVVIADHHKMIRDVIVTLLHSNDDFKVVGEAENGIETVTMTLDLKPSVLLLEVNLPEMNGIDAAKRILQKEPTQKILIFTLHESRKMVIRAMQLGISGYVDKNSSSEKLISAIRRVDLGFRHYPARVREHGASNSPNIDMTFQLTPKEHKVLDLIAKGKTNKEIALALSINVRTVLKHRETLMTKLNRRNVAGLNGDNPFLN